MVQSLLNFWHANKPLCILLVHMVLSAIVAVTPKRYQKKAFWGLLLKVAHFQSTLAHHDDPGTLQIPIIRKVLAFGRQFIDAADGSLTNPVSK